MYCEQVNWDVSMQTAVSDLEVVARAVKGKMYKPTFLQYKVVTFGQVHCEILPQ